MATDYSRFTIYQTELDFDLNCQDCTNWQEGEFRVSSAVTLKDLMDLADEHRRTHHDGA
jgi:hypothetical protein